MAVKPENQARTSINSKIPSHIHREKMGAAFSSGTADQWYSGKPCDLWVEYKFLEKPPTRGFKLDLSTRQLNWLRNRYLEGRAIAVVLCFPAKIGCWVFKNLEWEGGENGKVALPTEFLTRQQVADLIEKACTDYGCNSTFVRSSESC